MSATVSPFEFVVRAAIIIAVAAVYTWWLCRRMDRKVSWRVEVEQGIDRPYGYDLDGIAARSFGAEVRVAHRDHVARLTAREENGDGE